MKSISMVMILLKIIVQKYEATSPNYDFRLESKSEYALKSWAVPKGIPLDPKTKD
jgi:hypothetical protein